MKENILYIFIAVIVLGGFSLMMSVLPSNKIEHYDTFVVGSNPQHLYQFQIDFEYQQYLKTL